jgi:uncharacterized protein (TIGR02757 family)
MGRASPRRDPASLKPALDRLYDEFDRVDSASDPVHLVRPFADRADREVAAFCAAALAFGRVASVLASIEALFARMGPSPAAFVRGFEPARDAPVLAPLVHRWTKGPDFAALLWILRRMTEESGSIERFFLDGLDPAAIDVGAALESFSTRARQMDLQPVYGRRRSARAGPRAGVRPPGVHFFFPRPSRGSACKRLNLFLRWMVRRDAIDLGVWTRVPPSVLVVPLDTHVIRVGRCLGLTSYRSPGWRMAADVTASLRRIDPRDPVRYDFSLCHLGMMNACGFGRTQGDRDCPLRGLCRPRSR